MAESAGSLYLINAETGDTSQCSGVVQDRGISFTVDIAALIHGSFGFKVLYNGAYGLAYGYITFVPIDTEWFRCYIHIPSAMLLSGTYKYIRVMKILDGAVTIGSVGFRSGGTTAPASWYMLFGASGQFSTTNFSLDIDHYIEFKYVKNASVGGIEMLVDGTQILTDIDQDTSSIEVDTLRFGQTDDANFGANGAYFYLDDLRGNNTQNGAYSDVVSTIMNMMQGYNLGADLFNGALI